jgi:hypothetical protein
MNRLLFILLLAAATAHGQINNPPTSVNIVDATATGRAVLTATNAAAAATAISLGTTNDVEFRTVKISPSISGGYSLVVTSAIVSAVSLFEDIEAEELDAVQGVFGGTVAINSVGISFTTNTAAAATRTNLGLSLPALTNTNVVNFRTGIGLVGSGFASFNSGSSGNDASGEYASTVGGALNTASGDYSFAAGRNAKATNQGAFVWADSQTGNFSSLSSNTFNVRASGGMSLDLGTNGISLRNPAAAANTRANLGLGETNAVTFSNVTVNGSLSVGSFTTTTPSTWALDATQTAASTNGVLTLPSNANVIRLTNNNEISSVTNGVLGAFYYLVNQATNAVTISNVGGIVIDGAQNLTLSPNESATLVATGPTNVSVVNRGDLTDVALGGTANTAPQQTADSASSLMTRELGDNHYLGEMFSAATMDYYGPPTIVDFKTARVIQYTNAQAQGPFMWALLDPNKYAGKTVRVVGYCRVDSTNGGIVAGLGRIHYLTNISGGGADPNFPLSAGGAGTTFGVLPESPTFYNDFNVGNSTNSYVVMTNNSGTIPTNAKLIGVSFGFDRSLTNNTFTNNLYLQAVQVVVENP